MNKDNSPLTQHIYILGDKFNSKLAKIGVSKQIDGRLQQHYTSNPNAYVYFKEEYDFSFAARMEKTIKSFYKQDVASGSEWFNVSCHDLEKFLMSLVNTEMSSTDFNKIIRQGKSTHQLSHEEREVFKVDQNGKYSPVQRDNARFIFSQNFKLGIPSNLLPINVLKNNGFPINFVDCDINSKICKKYFDDNALTRRIIHKDDHIEYFYYLLELSSGSYFAYPTARASLPYIQHDISHKDKRNILVQAEQLGWEVTFHNEWSWHLPDSTGLVLFTCSPTNIEKLELQWKGSLKKWVIENFKILENYFYFDEDIQQNINTIINEIKEDINFPLDIKSFEDLYKSKYLDIKVQIISEKGINGDKRLEKLLFKGNIAYRLLFRLWKASVKTNQLNKNTLNISKERMLQRIRKSRLVVANILMEKIKDKNLLHKENEFNLLKDKYLSDIINYECFVERFKEIVEK